MVDPICYDITPGVLPIAGILKSSAELTQQLLFRCLQETYKLPHRLIEKKRRDRINECIAQLKDLLPEHLKLTVSSCWSWEEGKGKGGRDDGIHCVLSGMHHRVAVQGYYIT